MTTPPRWTFYLLGLLCPTLLWAQERPALTETALCNDTKKSAAECKPEELSTKRAFTDKDKELYAEHYGSDGALVMVKVESRSGLSSSCSNIEGGKMLCEYIDVLDQAGLSTNITKPKAQKRYRSDKELAAALGAKEADITALGIDWRFSQVVVWSVKTPKSKGFVVTSGEVTFATTKNKAGTVVLPFFESCPHGGIPGSEATAAPAVTVVVALVPTYFTVAGAKAKLEKAGFAPSMCNTIPRALGGPKLTPPKP